MLWKKLVIPSFILYRLFFGMIEPYWGWICFVWMHLISLVSGEGLEITCEQLLFGLKKLLLYIFVRCISTLQLPFHLLKLRETILPNLLIYGFHLIGKLVLHLQMFDQIWVHFWFFFILSAGCLTKVPAVEGLELGGLRIGQSRRWGLMLLWFFLFKATCPLA